MGSSAFTVRAGGLGTIGGQSSGVPWYRRLFGLGGAGAEHRPPRAVWHNPIAWREAAARNATLGRIIARWAFVAMGGLFGLALVVLFHTGSLNPTSFRLSISATVWGELAVISLVAINMAGTAISREREDGTLDLLLTTPLTASAYLKGKLRGLIAYLLPMLAVPLGTLLFAGLYVMADGLGNKAVMVSAQASTVKIQVPVILPEAGLIAPFVVIPFIAFCVMIGLQWSLKSKGTIGSVVATVGVVGAISGVLGLCAWTAGSGLQFAGPVLAGLSPASAVYAFVDPATALSSTVANSGNLQTARVALGIGCILAAVVYALVCYGLHTSMVRTFDMTVRKLAGMK
jgi:hypothetical protein